MKNSNDLRVMSEASIARWVSEATAAGGKKLIYNHIDLPLTAIADFEEAGKTDPLFAELDRICKAYRGLWNPEAEKHLLANAKAI